MSETKAKRNQQKDIARTLYIKGDATQKEICENIGVSEQTMVKWAKEGDWENMRESLTTTKAKQLSILYTILAGLTAEAKTALEDDDPDTNPDVDSIAKISKSIERLEKDTGVGEMMITGIDFLKYVQNEDIEAAKIINKWFYIFIQDKMKEAK
jgi:DNA-binding XRE family transcriptional regulator